MAPGAANAATIAAATVRTPPQPADDAPHLLLVDDDRRIRDLLSRFLCGEGYRVTRVDVDRNIAATLASVKPDACFNALHGRWGEDGCVQGLLEVLGIPYTHSGVLASSLAMHKEQTKRIVAKHGVPVAEGRQVTPEQALADHIMAPPYVAKPISEGSSVGVVIVRAGANRPPDVLARRLFARGGVKTVHINSSVITIELSETGTDGIREVIEGLYTYYVPGVVPPTDEELLGPAE